MIDLSALGIEPSDIVGGVGPRPGSVELAFGDTTILVRETLRGSPSVDDIDFG